jgi:hypothetical protein
MKRLLLFGFAIACASSALAQTQTPTTPPSSQAAAGSPNETTTLIGCVAGGASASDPFMLSDVTRGSVGANTPGQTTSGALPPPTSAAGTPRPV